MAKVDVYGSLLADLEDLQVCTSSIVSEQNCTGLTCLWQTCHCLVAASIEGLVVQMLLVLKGLAFAYRQSTPFSRHQPPKQQQPLSP